VQCVKQIFTYAEGSGLRRLAAAFSNGGLVAGFSQLHAANKFADLKREQAPALQNRRPDT